MNAEVPEAVEPPMDDGQETVWRRVKRVREARRMSQIELADKSGLSRGWLNRFEGGHEPGVKLLSLDALARGLGFPDWHAVAALNLVDYERSRPAPDLRAVLELRAELEALRTVVEKLRPPAAADGTPNDPKQYHANDSAAALMALG